MLKGIDILETFSSFGFWIRKGVQPFDAYSHSSVTGKWPAKLTSKNSSRPQRTWTFWTACSHLANILPVFKNERDKSRKLKLSKKTVERDCDAQFWFVIKIVDHVPYWEGCTWCLLSAPWMSVCTVWFFNSYCFKGLTLLLIVITFLFSLCWFLDLSLAKLMIFCQPDKKRTKNFP